MGGSLETLRRLEKGKPALLWGTFMRALRVIGLERGLDRLAADDDLRRKLHNLELFGPRHDAAQPGTEKRLPNKAVFSYRLLLSNVKFRALRQNDAPCHGPSRTPFASAARGLASESCFASYGCCFRSLCLAGTRKSLICKESVSLLMACSTIFCTATQNLAVLAARFCRVLVGASFPG